MGILIGEVVIATHLQITVKQAGIHFQVEFI